MPGPSTTSSSDLASLNLRNGSKKPQATTGADLSYYEKPAGRLEHEFILDRSEGASRPLRNRNLDNIGKANSVPTLVSPATTAFSMSSAPTPSSPSFLPIDLPIRSNHASLGQTVMSKLRLRRKGTAPQLPTNMTGKNVEADTDKGFGLSATTRPTHHSPSNKPPPPLPSSLFVTGMLATLDSKRSPDTRRSPDIHRPSDSRRPPTPRTKPSEATPTPPLESVTYNLYFASDVTSEDMAPSLSSADSSSLRTTTSEDPEEYVCSELTPDTVEEDDDADTSIDFYADAFEDFTVSSSRPEMEETHSTPLLASFPPVPASRRIDLIPNLNNISTGGRRELTLQPIGVTITPPTPPPRSSSRLVPVSNPSRMRHAPPSLSLSGSRASSVITPPPRSSSLSTSFPSSL